MIVPAVSQREAVGHRQNGFFRGTNWLHHRTMDTEAPPPLVGAFGQRRVLVADDNVDAAESLAALLRLLGHEVAVAFDGEQVLTIAAEFRPAVVLLDVGMPRMDGLEAARRLRATEHGAAAVIVALSGFGDVNDEELAREAGFDAHRLKPISADDLQTVLALQRS
jgi:CheY-like chemotaxis protein